ncbi:MAG: hypothetical protein K2Q01_02610, partial [Rickettsiales bacterium]|nr:hypothetical protein [Rickettsiales bacterium]
MTAVAAHVTIVADAQNDMVLGDIKRQLDLALSAEGTGASFTLSPRLMGRLQTQAGQAELRSELNQKTDLVVAMLGVP